MSTVLPRLTFRTNEDEEEDEDEKGNSERIELNALLTPSASIPSTSLPTSASSSSSSSSRSALSSAYFSSSLYGTLSSESVPLFERLVFRISRGNAILHVYPIDPLLHDPLTHQSIRKSAFVLIHVGEEMEKRLKKCIAVVGGTEFDLPGGAKERLRLAVELRERRAEVQRVLQRTEQEIQEQLGTLAWDEGMGCSPWWNWTVSLQRERGICEMLRRCDQSDRSRMLVCEGWVQTDHLSELQVVLHHAVAQTSAQQAALQILPLSPALLPPTYFPTSQFTVAFQSIVDTYGIPRYKEINPGLFTLISFPFLFGVMYGDIGHGTILTLSALYLLYHENRLLALDRRGEINEILSMVFNGRYLILLMGLFAVYCGFVYNDCFSIPIPLFPSTYQFNSHSSFPHHDGVYPFGVDWEWYGTQNELAFFNSMKMKMSVIIGVTQMLFGVFLSAANHRFFGDSPALYFEFIPRLLFLLCTFGYMCFLIVFKWTIDFSAPQAPPAVNLIQTMISMFLQPGSVDAAHQLYAGQAVVQSMLLLIAVGAVPVMLLGVPWTEKREHERKLKEEGGRSGGGGSSRGGLSTRGGGAPPHWCHSRDVAGGAGNGRRRIPHNGATRMGELRRRRGERGTMKPSQRMTATETETSSTMKRDIH